MKHAVIICLSIQLVTAIAWPNCVEALRPERNQWRARARHSERQVERLKRVMVPLLGVANRPLRPEQVRVSIVDESAINAASAGNGEFYVTTGLLSQATDDQLRGVLAHEIAHEDLGHPMKAQVLGTGLGLGAALLEQFLPGTSKVAPIAGTLITGHYSRPMELAADRHAVDLLQRVGYSKITLIKTLTWLMRQDGDRGGGIFATHPAISDRIQALQKLR